MAASAQITLNLGVVKLTYTQDELTSLRGRFSRGPLYKGPCMILSRATGLALDCGPDGHSGKHNVLWTPHAGPWQQWRLRGIGAGQLEIVSEHTNLRLTTMAKGYDWGETWCDRKLHSDWSTKWRLKTSDDGVAFVIENASSGFALDAGRDATNGRDPHVSETNWDPWQQWIILRLPLK
jgi:hypothetical protein